MLTALLLIDIQNDYFPGGAMELEGSPEAARRARRLLDFFRAGGWPPIHIQHVAVDAAATFFRPGTAGVEPYAETAPLAGERVFQKHFPNAFRETLLLDHLRSLGTERLVIAGMMTHMCVDATVRAAADLGFQVLLAADACATRSLAYGGTSVPAAHVQAAFLSAFRAYARVLTTDEVLAVLQET